MEQKINEIIKKEFNATTLKIEKINEGFSHHMYDVKIDEAPFEVIVRFSNNAKEDVNLGKEKYVIELLRSNGIPAPKIFSCYHPIRKEEGYMVMEKLHGVRLDTIWQKLSKHEKIQITKEMGKMLAKMHSINLENFGVIEEDGRINSDNPFKFRKTGESISFDRFVRVWLKDSLKDIARLASYEHVSKQFIADFTSYVLKNLNKVSYSGEPVFVHGDFMLGHIFVENKDDNYVITGIIDFEFAYAYSPDYDFIKLHRAGFFADAELKKALQESHGAINEDAVEIFRLMRDVGFAWAVLEAGNKELCDKVLKDVGEAISKKIIS